MKISNFFLNNNLDNSFVIGYYGGSNFGDELLLEVIQAALHKGKYKNVNIRYNGDKFSTYHKDYGYSIIDGRVKSLIKGIIRSKNIIIGGGGHWGLDFNRNIFFLSVVLFFARFILFKKVYLIGVGYYNSTPFLGKISAWIVGVSSSLIISRDKETYNNFNRILFINRQKNSLDKDIVFNIDIFIQEDLYESEYHTFLDTIPAKSDIMIGLRRFNNKKIKDKYFSVLQQEIQHSRRPTLFAFENINMFKQDYSMLLNDMGRIDKSVVNFEYNPVLLYLWFKRLFDQYHAKLITPQFHVIMIAHLAGVEFVPIAYDNKVTELFKQIGINEEKVIKLYE